MDDFLFSKLFKSVNVEGRRAINEVLRALFRQKLQDNSSVSTVSHLFNIEKYRKKVRGVITRYGLHLLERDPLTTEFDITGGIILLQGLFSNEYRKLSVHCQAQINSLRELRNFLSHKYPLAPHDFGPYKQVNNLLQENEQFVTLGNEINELEEKKNSLDSDVEKTEIQDLIDDKEKEKCVITEIENLRMILSDILENAGSVLGKDFTDCRRMIDKNLTDISKAKVTQYDQDTYDIEIKRFKDDPIHELITKGREELKNQYRSLKIANPCPWINMDENEKSSIRNFSIDKIYTPLRIDGSKEITVEELLLIMKESKNKTAVVLYGLAGSGKTSLCLHFLHNWSEDTDELKILKDYSLVIYVELRKVRENNITGYLKKQRMKESTRHIDPDEVVQCLDNLKLLFIIDGYDEARKESKDVVKDIFAMFPDQNIMVTTRTEFREEVKLIGDKHYVTCKSLEIGGFDEPRMQKFTEKVFDAVMHSKYYINKPISKARDSTSFLRYVHGRGSILERHLELPLTLALMIYMWIDCPDVLNNVTTCTSLYYELFNLCQQRIKDRISFSGPDRDIENLLLLIGKKAWQLLQNEEELLQDEDEIEIDEECKKRGIPKEELLSAFLMFEPDDDSDENRYDYAFMHRTQMEYLSAFFWAEEAGKKDLNYVVGPDTSLRGFHQILMFLVGHLTRKTMLWQKLKEVFELVAKADVEDSDFNFWWCILTESQIDGKPNRELLYKISREKLDKGKWKLTKDTVVSGLELLTITPVRINELIIDITTGKDPYDIKGFHTIMKSMQERLYGRYGKKNPILTELFFWQHYEKECEKPSNDLLRTLYPWGHLRDFAGSVEEYDEEFSLNFCFKLKNLRVRVNTKEAQISLCSSLEKISRSLSNLRVILALTPNNCNPDSLNCLTSKKFKGDLELTLPHMNDEDKEWIVNVTKRVSGE